MNRNRLISLIAIALGCLLLSPGLLFAGEIGFAGKPAAAPEGKGARITFAAKAPTDCAVWVLDGEGNAVRHLAAGVLGPAAPAPLERGKLEQSLLWDGKDDHGEPVPAGKYTVRVGLGTVASFDRIIGHDPQWLGNIRALAVGPEGKLYVLSDRGVVVLDREGKYLKQIVPAPDDLPLEKLAGLEPRKLADGSVCFLRDYPLPGEYAGSIAVTSKGELLIPGASRFPRNLIRIGLDGSVPEGAFDTKLTRLQDNGYLHLAASPDGEAVYMSGAESGYKGDDARKVVYRQSVYKLLLASKGPAEIFTGDDENRGKPGFAVNQPKGLAVDPEGRLYVCNYGNGTIAVYSPGAGMVKSVAVPHPHYVAVNPKTGQMYVLSGVAKGYSKYGYDYPPMMKEAKLLRLSADGEIEQELELPDAHIRKGATNPGPNYRLRMAVDFSGEKPVVWLGVSYPNARYAKWNLLRIEDDGEKFGEPREVCPKPEGVLLGTALQVRLDRERDLIYVNDQSSRLARFTGDGEMLEPLKLVRPGPEAKTHISEIALDADGNICALTWGRWKSRNNFLVRYTPEGEWMPFEAGDEAGVPLSHVMKGAGGHSTRGFTVAPDGSMLVMYYDDNRPTEGLEPWDSYPLNIAVARYDSEGNLKDPRLIAHLRAGAQCIRVGRAGAIYVADNMMPVGTAYPRDLAAVLPDPLKRFYPARIEDGTFDPLLRWMGSVFKFGPEGGKIIGLPAAGEYPAAKRPAGDLWKPVPETQWFTFHGHKLKVTGAEWQFHGMSPVPALYQGVTHVDRCICRGGRFDLDEFDRVFVPDRLRHRITVLDPAGNVVTRFGRYGNQDSAGPEIGLCDPWWVAAASDRVFVGDGKTWRIVKAGLAPTVAEVCEIEIK